ncbi:AAA family ATPase [Planomonospora sp. ID67723]|uniref:ATP-binding protein n=1 Tax=Planomonospora sp. ID67723 TaxID=2738134 RepID=UPI0018C39383|nr:AAA family ATPase [Planomonospora sp. ID67723]MBG0829725.1 AAA family ATPase [Planomonospora sp. ID67723]
MTAVREDRALGRRLSPGRAPSPPGRAGPRSGRILSLPAVSLPHPAPFAGRGREMARLDAAVTAGRRGTPVLLEIVGDPGVGKTRLLSELALTAGDTMNVLSGRVSGFEREQAFGVFAEPVREILRARPSLVRGLDDRTRALLEAVGSGLALRGRKSPYALPDAERFEFFETVTRMVEHAARPEGVLLCLDDLHWADDGTIALLHHLIRHPPAVPLIVACSYRPRQASARLTACLRDTANAIRADRIELSPLDRNAVDQILGPDVAIDRRARLYRTSGGNPRYLEALSRVRRLSPDSPDAVGTFLDGMPDSVRSPLLGELVPLEPDHREVLRVAAALGDPIDPVLLAEVTGKDASATMAALDALAGRDLIRPASRDGIRPSLCFRHPLLRQLVYEETAMGARLAVHRRADLALRRRGAGPVERAPHVARSAQRGDTAALRLLAEAAGQIMRTAPATAAAWLRAALPLGGDRSTRLDVLEALSRALVMTGRLEECRRLLPEILSLLDADRPDRRLEIITVHAAAARLLGDYRGACAILGPELSALKNARASAGSRALLELAVAKMMQRRYDECRELVGEAAERAPAGSAGDLLAAAAACLALGAAYRGDRHSFAEHVRHAATAYDTMDDPDLMPHLDPLSQLAWAEALAERHQDALRHFTRGLALARLTGQHVVMPYLLLGLAYVHITTGRVDEALRAAVDAEEAASLLSRSDMLGFALALRGWATAMRDGPEAAAPLAERGLRHVNARGLLWEVASGVLAHIRLAQRRPDDCLGLLRSVDAHIRHPSPVSSLRPMWHCLAALAAEAADRPGEARLWAERAGREAAAHGLDGAIAFAALARAQTCAPQDRGRIERLGEAAEKLSASGLALVECSTRLLLARNLITLRRLGEAAVEVERVKTLANACGARFLYTKAVNAQRRIGASQPRRPTATDSTLTRRESEIAQLVSLGMSNQAIATMLHLSVKTVEAHLTKIYRKLRTRSRPALAAMFTARHGEHPDR